MKKYIPAVLIALGLLTPAFSFAQTTSGTCVNLTSDLQYGMSGPAVIQLQTFLHDRGFLKVDPSQFGYFGPYTQAAVRAFQVSQGISATGYVGYLTRQKITALSCGSDAKSPTAGTSQPVIKAPAAATEGMLSYGPVSCVAGSPGSCTTSLTVQGNDSTITYCLYRLDSSYPVATRNLSSGFVSTPLDVTNGGVFKLFTETECRNFTSVPTSAPLYSLTIPPQGGAASSGTGRIVFLSDLNSIAGLHGCDGAAACGTGKYVRITDLGGATYGYVWREDRKAWFFGGNLGNYSYADFPATQYVQDIGFDLYTVKGYNNGNPPLSDVAPLDRIVAHIPAVCTGTALYNSITGQPCSADTTKSLPLSTVACTADAKLCPDGSYVSRVAPSCEFAACPTYSNPVTTVNAPEIGALSPSTGTPGTQVSFYATALTSTGNTLTFGSTKITSFQINGQTVTFTVPTSAAAGSYKVYMTNSGMLNSNSQTFTITTASPGISAPVIAAIAPTSGVAGTQVTFSAAGLTGSGTNTLYFGNTTVPNFTVNGSMVTFLVPGGTGTGSFAVKMSNSSGQSSNNLYFTVTVPADTPPTSPVVGALSPSSGPVGTQVSMTVTGLTTTGNTLYFAGFPIPFTLNGTTVTFTVPPTNLIGAARVQMTNSANTASAGQTFTVTAPVISSINPSSGVPGIQVSLTVAGLSTSGNTLYFAGLPISFSQNGSTITFTVPATPTPGDLKVQVANANGVLSNLVTFTATTPSIAPPVISSIAPASGVAGDQVTFSAAGLTGSGTNTLYFGTMTVPNFTVNGSMVTFAVPSGTGTGSFKVQMTNSSGQPSNTLSFTVNPVVTAPPVITLTTGAVTATAQPSSTINVPDRGTFVLPLVITTGSTGAYIANTAGTSGTAGVTFSRTVTSSGSVTLQATLTSSAMSGDTATAFYIPAYSSRTLTLTVGATATADGYTGIQVTGINFSSSSSLSPNYVLGASGAVKTSDIYLQTRTSNTPVTPVMGALSPASGPIGTQVSTTITGLTTTGNILYFAGGVIPFAVNGTTVTFMVPSTATPGQMRVQLMNGGGLVTSGQWFTVSQVLGASKFTFTQYLQLGSSGNEVAELQKALTAQGYYHDDITGYFGPITEAAVKSFQTEFNLEASGTVGPLTREKLNAL